MSLISSSFGDGDSIKSAYSAGIEDWIYIRFAKTTCKWNSFWPIR